MGNSIDQDLIESLQTDLALPDDVEVLETTEVVETIEAVSPEGEVTGTCQNGICSCEAGFVEDKDGSCRRPSLKDEIVESKTTIEQSLHDTFGADSQFADLIMTPLNKITDRLLKKFDRHVCPVQGRKRRSTRGRRSDNICDDLFNGIETMKTWSENNIQKCGNLDKRNKFVAGQIDKFGRIQNRITKKCAIKLARLADD